MRPPGIGPPIRGCVSRVSRSKHPIFQLLIPTSLISLIYPHYLLNSLVTEPTQRRHSRPLVNHPYNLRSRGSHNTNTMVQWRLCIPRQNMYITHNYLLSFSAPYLFGCFLARVPFLIRWSWCTESPTLGRCTESPIWRNRPVYWITYIGWTWCATCIAIEQVNNLNSCWSMLFTCHLLLEWVASR